MKENKKRAKFSYGITVFFVTLSSTVGLGNIWKFPSLAGENGGAAFVLFYIIALIFAALPVMISEFIIGRKSRSNVFDAFTVLKTSPFWKLIGIFGVISGFCILFFYSAVAGWVYSYVFKAIRGDFSQLSTMTIEEAGKNVSQQFSAVAGGEWWPIIWQLIALTVIYIILMGGVKNGIERFTKILMPIFLILILLCCFWSLTLPGFGEGFTFLFKVDFSKLTVPVMLGALGLSFFKLSVGMGTMITYGSYFSEKENLIGTGTRVAFSDLLVSLIFGLIVFPIVFTYGLEPTNGPALLFNTIPLVFSLMPFGNILLIIFFLLASIAATTAMISMAQVSIAIISEKFNINEKVSTLIIVLTCGVVGVLTVHPTSLFGEFKLPGLNMNFFDFFDKLSSIILLPLGGLMIAIFVGHVLTRKIREDELTNNGELKNSKLVDVYSFIMKYITPALIALIFTSPFIMSLLK